MNFQNPFDYLADRVSSSDIIFVKWHSAPLLDSDYPLLDLILASPCAVLDISAEGAKAAEEGGNGGKVDARMRALVQKYGKGSPAGSRVGSKESAEGG